MNETVSHPTSMHPCPYWCTLPRGHGYDGQEAGTANLVRSHVGEGHDTVLSGIAGSDHIVNVDLAAMETASPDGGRVLAVTPVELSVLGYREGDALDAAAARRLAAALLDGADRFDEVTGGTS